MAMGVVLRRIPVLFACRGCERDHVAQEVAAALDRRGVGEASVAGRDSAKARGRYPVYTIEGCDKGCAESWLRGHGVVPQRRFVLDPAADVEAEARRAEQAFA